MAGKIKGITIEFDGDVSRLQKSLKSVDSATKKINTELGKLEKALKFNPGNTELLAQKYRRLSEKVDETKKKLEALKEVDKNAKKQLESGDLGQAEYDKLQREIIETESQLKNFSKQVKELDNYKLTKLGEQFTTIGEKLKGVGDKLQNLGSKLTTRVTAPIVAIGGAGFKMAADLEDAMGATDQIFKGSSDEMKRWADNIDSYYGIAESEALGYANTMGAMLKNIGGLSEQEAAKQSQTLTQLAGDLSAMFGGTTESAVQALTNALKGNTSMLDNYGMGVNDATIKQKAFEMGIYSGTGALGLQEKQAATLALIMEQTADAQGQAGREAEGASGSMKTLTTEVKGLATSIGEVLLPIVTPLVQKLSDWVEKFKELSPAQQDMIVKTALLAAALGPVLTVVGKLMGLFGVFSTGIGTLITKITALSTSGGALGSVFSLISSHFLTIVGGIGLVIAAFVSLWKNNEEFRTAITEIWNSIKLAAMDLFNGIKERLSGLQEAFTNIINFIEPIWTAFTDMLAPAFEGAFEIIETVFTTVTDVILGILDIFIGVFTGDWEKAWDGVKSIFSSVWEAIENIIDTVITTIGSVIETGVNFVTTTVTNVWNGLKNTVTGIWEAMSSSIENVWNGIKTTISNVVNGIKDTVSNVFGTIKETATNTWNGIKSAIETPINKAKEIVSNAINTIKGLFNFDFQWPKLKMPHFSIKGSMNPLKWLSEGVPKLSVDWYAQGGIFDRPSVIGVGEAGQEAVLPTHKLDKFLEEAVSRVSGQGQGQGSGITINIENAVVREESDIRRIAEEVNRLFEVKKNRLSTLR